MKPVQKKKLIGWLLGIADQLDLPAEERDEDFEDGGVSYTIREAAKIIEQYAPKELK